jgi:pyruvate dehydrogenase E1 component alpha subunit
MHRSTSACITSCWSTSRSGSVAWTKQCGFSGPGHSRADPGKYRPQEEVDSWLARDPVPAYRQQLLDDGVDATALDQIEADATAEIDDATEQASAAPPPDPSVITTDVWADGGSSWRN